MENLYDIVKKPIVTERATNLKAKVNQYVFKVAPSASKQDIKRAIQELFKVKVVSVNTLRVPGKFRRMGGAPGSYRSDWKKAIVRLQAGQEIKVEEAQ